MSKKAKKKAQPKKKPVKKVVPQDQQDYILLDRTGSMQSLWGEAIRSINSYVAKLGVERVPTKVTLIGFDLDGEESTFDVFRDRVEPKRWLAVGLDEITPRGMTPLNDAIGKLVARAEKDAPSRAALIIMTDGYENSSKEYTQAQAKEALERCRKKGWQVIFLGANFNNAGQAASYGNLTSQTIHASAANLGATMSDTASMRGLYGVTGQNISYSVEQKRRAKQ